MFFRAAGGFRFFFGLFHVPSAWKMTRSNSNALQAKVTSRAQRGKRSQFQSSFFFGAPPLFACLRHWAWLGGRSPARTQNILKAACRRVPATLHESARAAGGFRFLLGFEVPKTAKRAEKHSYGFKDLFSPLSSPPPFLVYSVHAMPYHTIPMPGPPSTFM